ncbi:hypothetical protein SESBI_24425 [Sesbania bispinosa]|nr:hypothetical protein SESBI_24425 [Sesbania bispinosa]
MAVWTSEWRASAILEIAAVMAVTAWRWMAAVAVMAPFWAFFPIFSGFGPGSTRFHPISSPFSFTIPNLLRLLFRSSSPKSPATTPFFFSDEICRHRRRLRRGQPPSATGSAALYNVFSSLLRAVQALFLFSARSARCYSPQATSSSLLRTYCSLQQPLRYFFFSSAHVLLSAAGSGEGQVGTSTNLSKRAKGVAAKNKGKRVGVVEEAEASEDSSSEEDELVPNADFIHSDGEEAEGFLNEQNHHVEINYADIDDEED